MAYNNDRDSVPKSFYNNLNKYLNCYTKNQEKKEIIHLLSTFLYRGKNEYDILADKDYLELMFPNYSIQKMLILTKEFFNNCFKKNMYETIEILKSSTY